MPKEIDQGITSMSMTQSPTISKQQNLLIHIVKTRVVSSIEVGYGNINRMIIEY